MIAIIGAMDYEIMLIKDSMTDKVEEIIAGASFIRGKIAEKEVLLTQSHVGKVNAAITATIAIIMYKCDLIINTGIAGGNFPLKTGDIVLANKIINSDVDVTKLGYSYGEIPGMPCFYTPDFKMTKIFKTGMHELNYNYQDATILSGDEFVTSLDKLSKFTLEGNIAFEMEGSGIAQTAYRFSVPFLSIRYISDIVGSSKQIENYSVFERDMAINSAKVLIELVSIIK